MDKTQNNITKTAKVSEQAGANTAKSNTQVSDKTAKSSKQASDKTAKSSKQASDKTAKSNTQVSDKTAKVSEQVSDKTAKLSEQVSDKTAKSSKQVSDKSAKVSEQVSDKTAENLKHKNQTAGHQSLPFDNDKYKQLQREEILNRINKFGRLYMEVGGKLFDDNHASRVLPGFQPDVKMQIFRELKSEIEVILCVNLSSLVYGKTRSDNNLKYGDETLRLAKLLKSEGFDLLGIMISFYEPNEVSALFESKCAKFGIKTFHSYRIEGYPKCTEKILSAEGFGKNDYIKPHKNLILVCAPGANSGKMQTCFSQIYHEQQKNINACYAKYETFPVWNLPLNHLVNIAYEMATIDVGDKNMIDPFFKKSHSGMLATNYNRDIETFSILSKILNKSLGYEVYDSPTSMGINFVGFAINYDLAVQKASLDEIERRHQKHTQQYLNKSLSKSTFKRSCALLKKAQKIYKILVKNK